MIKNKLIKGLSLLLATTMIATSGVPVSVMAEENSNNPDFVAADIKNHNHTYVDNWSYDDNAHWKDFTCGCKANSEFSKNPTFKTHNFKFTKYIEPQGSENGYSIYTCQTCGFEEKRDYKPHNGNHEWKLYAEMYEGNILYDYYRCSIEGCEETKKVPKISSNDSQPANFYINVLGDKQPQTFSEELELIFGYNLKDYDLGTDTFYYEILEDNNKKSDGYISASNFVNQNEDLKNTTLFKTTLGVESESHKYTLITYPVIKDKNNNYQMLSDYVFTDNYQIEAPENHTWNIKYDDNSHWKQAICHPNIIKDKEEHNWTLDTDSYVQATCQHEGYEKYICYTCGAEKEEKPSKTDHDWESLLIDGHEVRKCGWCDTMECVGEHNGKWNIVKDATDTEDGIKEKVCTICGKVLDTQTFKKDNVKNETPTVKILSEDITRTVGNYMFQIRATVDNGATISFSSSNPKVATIDNNGIVTVHGVGKTVLTAKVNAIKGWNAAEDSITLTIEPEKVTHNHVFDTKWTANKSFHWHKCIEDGCDGTISGKAEHTVSDWIVDREATKISSGSRHKECTVCGYITETEEIPVVKPTHTHHWTNEWTSDKDYHWHKCTEQNCDGSVKDKTEHIPSDWIIDVKSTDTTTGRKHIECAVCGRVLATVTIPKTNHTFSKEWKSNRKSHWHECINNDGAKSNYESHTPSDWIIDKPATEFSGGRRHIECTVCGYIMHEAIDFPILPIHTIDSEWSSDNNYHWHKCLDSGCNYVSDKEEHKPIYITESKVGTYTDGVVIKKCSVCGKELGKYTSYGFFTKSHYEKLKEQIKEYEEKGKTLNLNHGFLNKNDYIPKEFLEIIKGHDVEVELSIKTDTISSETLENSINIRFNGKDVKNPQDIYPGSKLTKAINFDDAKEKVEETLKTIVTKDNALDYALLLSAIKPSKLMYFSINNTTDFDFPIEYQLRYFYQDTDKYISLFHINDDGKLEFVKEIKNDADTGSWFTLTKTGNYVALASTTPIKDAKIDTKPSTPDKPSEPSTPDTPINPNPSTNNTPTLDNTVNNNSNTNDSSTYNETIVKTSTDENNKVNNNVSEIKKSVKTNDSNNIWYSIIISLLGFGAIFLALKKKHSINK